MDSPLPPRHRMCRIEGLFNSMTSERGAFPVRRTETLRSSGRRVPTTAPPMRCASRDAGSSSPAGSSTGVLTTPVKSQQGNGAVRAPTLLQHTPSSACWFIAGRRMLS